MIGVHQYQADRHPCLPLPHSCLWVVTKYEGPRTFCSAILLWLLLSLAYFLNRWSTAHIGKGALRWRILLVLFFLATRRICIVVVNLFNWSDRCSWDTSDDVEFLKQSHIQQKSNICLFHYCLNGFVAVIKFQIIQSLTISIFETSTF